MGFNPADFVIFVMQTEPKQKTDQLIRIWTQEQQEVRPRCTHIESRIFYCI